MADQLISTEDLCLANKAVAIITESLAHSITLTDLAKKVNTSPRKLKLVMEQFYIGQTIRELQLYLRIERAMILLYIEKIPPELAISHIGYKSNSSFNSAFKKVARQTVKQWISSLGK